MYDEGREILIFRDIIDHRKDKPAFVTKTLTFPKQ